MYIMDKVMDTYTANNENRQAEEAGQHIMEFINTKKILNNYISVDKRVIEIGCGGGYYGMHYAKLCQEYVGIDLSPENISVFQHLINEHGYHNVKAEVGDVTNLCNIEDDSFDVVMCLGPLYRLDSEARARCMAECARICKPGGRIALAFMNKTGVVAKFAPIIGWENVMTPKIDEFVLTKGMEDMISDIFFYAMPEEMISEAELVGLTYERLAGLDFLLFDEYIEQFTEEQRKVWFHFSDLVVNSEYCAGLSNNAMLICRK